MIGSEEAASLTDIPTSGRKELGWENWLTREQAKELLAVPDRSDSNRKLGVCYAADVSSCRRHMHSVTSQF
jgi:hypothetical protein